MSAQKLLGTDKKETDKVELVDSNSAQQTETIEIVGNSKDAAKMQRVVIKDECIETTVHLIIVSLSWTNSSIFQSTLENTFHINNWTDLSNSWLLFGVSSIMAITIIMIPLCWIDVQSDKFKKQLIADNKDEDEDDRSFFHKFEYLLQASISLVVSMTFRDASKITFERTFIEENNVEATTYVLYAILWTIVGVWSTIHLTNRQNRLKKNIINNMNNRNVITRFAIKQRYITLILLTLSYIMAWSWRGAIDIVILTMYGGDKSTTVHVWIYCIIMTLTISFLVSLSEHFYCLYPKQISSQTLFVKSRTVQETNKLISDNCKFVVGFAWHDAIRITVFYYSTKSAVFNVLILYWLVAITMVCVSILGTHKFNQQKIKNKIDAIGLIKWMSKTKQSLQTVVSIHHDRNSMDRNGGNDRNDGNNGYNTNEEMTYTQYEIPRICETFGFTLFALTMTCWSISGSLFIGNAVNYSILAIYYDLNSYNVEMEYEHITTGLWLQWVVVVVTLCITALIMLYLRRIINLFRTDRHELTAKLLSVIK